METLGFFIYRTISSANNDSVISSLPIWMPFISFLSLIAVAKTSKITLNNSGESGKPCLVPDLSGNNFSFSPLRTMLAVTWPAGELGGASRDVTFELGSHEGGLL